MAFLSETDPSKSFRLLKHIQNEQEGIIFTPTRVLDMANETSDGGGRGAAADAMLCCAVLCCAVLCWVNWFETFVTFSFSNIMLLVVLHVGGVGECSEIGSRPFTRVIEGVK